MVVLVAYALFVVVIVLVGLGHTDWYWYAIPPALIGVWTVVLLARGPVIGESQPQEAPSG
jgi:hypothetical protein